MTRLVFFCFSILLIVSCKKENPPTDSSGGGNSIPYSGTLIAKASFPGNNDRFDCLQIGGESIGYIGFGRGYNNYDPVQAYNDLWKYSVATDTWQQCASFPGGGRYKVAFFCIQDKLYVFGGLDSIYHNDLWEYDPDLDNWTQKASMNYSGIQFGYGYSVNDNGFMLVGDASGQSNITRNYKYDPIADAWAYLYLNPMPLTSASGMSHFNFGDSVYFCTKYSTDIYYSINNTWTVGQPVLQYNTTNADWESYNISFADSENGYAIIHAGSGYDNGACVYDKVYEYDPLETQWTMKSSFCSDGRFKREPYDPNPAKGFSINGSFYSLTGGNFHEYIP